MQSQEQQILDYLKMGRSLTPIEALNIFCCFRLASRINQLRREGHNIKTTTIYNNGKHYASYSLVPDECKTAAEIEKILTMR